MTDTLRRLRVLWSALLAVELTLAVALVHSPFLILRYLPAMPRWLLVPLMLAGFLLSMGHAPNEKRLLAPPGSARE